MNQFPDIKTIHIGDNSWTDIVFEPGRYSADEYFCRLASYNQSMIHKETEVRDTLHDIIRFVSYFQPAHRDGFMSDPGYALAYGSNNRLSIISSQGIDRILADIVLEGITDGVTFEDGAVPDMVWSIFYLPDNAAMEEAEGIARRASYGGRLQCLIKRNLPEAFIPKYTGLPYAAQIGPRTFLRAAELYGGPIQLEIAGNAERTLKATRDAEKRFNVIPIIYGCQNGTETCNVRL